MSTLELEGIGHRYRDAVAATFGGVDLSVREGEMLSVIGPSGSGKSTLLRVTAGLARPEAGRVLVDGTDVTAHPPEERGLTAMFQQPHLFTHLSVLDNVGFGPRLQGASRREARDIARRYLTLVHLENLGQRRTRQLSGGQQQRAALARALATERQVLLLDEPFSALDAGLRRSMHDLLREVRATLSPTIVMVTHDLDEAALADRAAVLADGRVQQVGTVSSLYQHPASVVVARLLGGFNEIPGHSDGTRHESTWGRADLPGQCAVRGPAILLARREQLLLTRALTDDGGREGLSDDGVRVRVTAVTRAGPRQVAVVEHADRGPAGLTTAATTRLEVELPLGEDVGPGQVLNLRLDPGHPVWAVPVTGDTHDSGHGISRPYVARR